MDLFLKLYADILDEMSESNGVKWSEIGSVKSRVIQTAEEGKRRKIFNQHNINITNEQEQTQD